MDVAIIGAGNVGGALARSITEAGHRVTISSRDSQDAENLAKETGARAARGNREAAEAAEVVILAVPYDTLTDLAEELGDAAAGKVVVDVTNRVNPEHPGQTLDGTSAAEQLQSWLPQARVVKAFNTAFTSRQADPTVEGTPIDGFVAADDEKAKATVLELVDAIGFRPVDAGPLAMARALEAMAALNIVLQVRQGLSWEAGWKLVGLEDAT